jgi:hypothetical protein
MWDKNSPSILHGDASAISTPGSTPTNLIDENVFARFTELLSEFP